MPSALPNLVDAVNPVRLVLLILGLLRWLPPPTMAWAQSGREADGADSRPEHRSDVIWTDALVPLAATFMATMAIVPFDHDIQSAFQDPRLQRNATLHGAADVLAYSGAQGPFLLGGTTFAVGRLFGVERLADLGLHVTEAAALAASLGAIGKGIAGRALPDVPPADQPGDFSIGRGFHARSGPYVSFPAGHCAVSFAAATVLTSEAERWRPGLGWKVGTAAYGAASLVALARMYQNRHWASDNPFGVLIGTWSGRAVVRRQHRGASSRLERWLPGVHAAPTASGGVVVGWSSNDAQVLDARH